MLGVSECVRADRIVFPARFRAIIVPVSSVFVLCVAVCADFVHLMIIAITSVGLLPYTHPHRDPLRPAPRVRHFRLVAGLMISFD